MKIIKRILNWDIHDWRHISFLFKNMLHGFWMADVGEIVEAYLWIKMHILYDSQRIYPPREVKS